MNDLPVDTTPEQGGIPQIPHLDINSYGDQQTFLSMLELIVNTLVDIVNLLVVKEAEREAAKSSIEIVSSLPN